MVGWFCVVRFGWLALCRSVWVVGGRRSGSVLGIVELHRGVQFLVVGVAFCWFCIALLAVCFVLLFDGDCSCITLV